MQKIQYLVKNFPQSTSSQSSSPNSAPPSAELTAAAALFLARAVATWGEKLVLERIGGDLRAAATALAADFALAGLTLPALRRAIEHMRIRFKFMPYPDEFVDFCKGRDGYFSTGPAYRPAPPALDRPAGDPAVGRQRCDALRRAIGARARGA